MPPKDRCDNHDERVAEGAANCVRLTNIEVWVTGLDGKIDGMKTSQDQMNGMVKLLVFLVTIFGVVASIYAAVK